MGPAAAAVAGDDGGARKAPGLYQREYALMANADDFGMLLLNAGAPMDARSDVFSLGLVLLETLTNRHLFTMAHVTKKPGSPPPGAPPGAKAEEEGNFSLAEMKALVEGYTPEDVARETEGLPEAVRAIVHRALQRDAAARHATAEELRHQLRTQLITLAPGYGRREAAEELAAVISEASAAREAGVPTERDVLPEHLDAHELLSEG